MNVLRTSLERDLNWGPVRTQDRRKLERADAADAADLAELD